MRNMSQCLSWLKLHWAALSPQDRDSICVAIFNNRYCIGVRCRVTTARGIMLWCKQFGGVCGHPLECWWKRGAYFYFYFLQPNAADLEAKHWPVCVSSPCVTRFFGLYAAAGLNLDEFRCRNGSSGYAATWKRRLVVKCGYICPVNSWLCLCSCIFQWGNVSRTWASLWLLA